MPPALTPEFCQLLCAKTLGTAALEKQNCIQLFWNEWGGIQDKHALNTVLHVLGRGLFRIPDEAHHGLDLWSSGYKVQQCRACASPNGCEFPRQVGDRYGIVCSFQGQQLLERKQFQRTIVRVLGPECFLTKGLLL